MENPIYNYNVETGPSFNAPYNDVFFIDTGDGQYNETPDFEFCEHKTYNFWQEHASSSGKGLAFSYYIDGVGGD
jgi:hypothetical protein